MSLNALRDFMGSSKTNESTVSHKENDHVSVLKNLIRSLMTSAFKGDINSQSRGMGTSASPPPGSINKVTFVHPTNEVIPEEEEGERTESGEVE